MFSVKVESKGLSICYGCLSTDRKTVLVGNNLDVFMNLLGVQQEFYTNQVLLCWECVAHLKKIRIFQNQIQHAQFLLQQSLFNSELLAGKSLSKLSSTETKKFYDDSIIYDDQELIPQKDKNGEHDISTNIIKREDSDLDNDSNEVVIDDSYSDNEVLTIDFNKLKQLEIIEDNIKKEPEQKEPRHKTKIQSIKRYESKATIKKLDANEEDLKKHWVKVTLTEKEIEDVLNRHKTSLGSNRFPLKCNMCKNSYKRGVDIRRHTTFNHTKPSFPTKCLECKIPIHSWGLLHEHWKKHNVYLRCVICDWTTHSLASMTKHYHRAHSNVYCCKTCDFTCSTLREFSDHYKKRHERIMCDHCGKSFIKKRTLEVHIKRNHTPATCLECNKTYAHYHVLENHYRMYHPHMVRADNRTELSYCVECDKQYASVYQYKRHLATAAKHTPPKPVRIPCPECGKVFARKIRMTNHFNSVHRNTTKHRCDLCNKMFCSAFSARTHRQHVHEKIPMPKNKMCDLCGRGFSTNRILTNHRRTHTGERPYKCAHCPATFAQRTAMKTHERTQHKTQWDTHSALSAAATLLELGDRNGN